MKKFIKNIHFGAVAVLLGLTMVFTQSAFKPAKSLVDSTYRPVPTSTSPNGWLNIDNLSFDDSDEPADNTYQCSGSIGTCSAIFDHVPTSPSDTPTGTVRNGSFALN
ncbi:hypothetical protein [Pedobacter sp. V48]|uniref:hypothetical protein n=1 Tax=Pedobacter sp. V48 TaxID=509635 RepID=UPI0003E47376|nr:hypothetical protein [Pedobacter sp. V48]ETZ19185.1 hypothetical protein N824_10615 [Pedobacter sp. V48]